MAILDFSHDAATIRQHVQSGVWANQTLDDYLQQHVRQRGDKAVLVDRRWRLTFAELERLARRCHQDRRGHQLHRFGISPQGSAVHPGLR